MLQNAKGKINANANYVPNVKKLTSYKIGDVLLGNIGPYLKKIWFADNNGGCTSDVLVIRIQNKYKHEILSKFLYNYLASDRFFTYNVRYAQGTQIPRGNKRDILRFSIPIPYQTVFFFDVE